MTVSGSRPVAAVSLPRVLAALAGALAAVAGALMAFALSRLRFAHTYRQEFDEGLAFFGAAVVEALGSSCIGECG